MDRPIRGPGAPWRRRAAARAPRHASFHLGLVLLPALALVPAGCMKAPPVVHPQSIAAPAIPLAPPLSGINQFGYLRAHQIVRFADRVGAGGVITFAAARGIDLSALDPERPLVVVLGDIRGPSIDKAPIAALLPIAPGTSMARIIAQIAGPGRTSQYAGGLAVNLNQPPVDAGHLGPLFDQLVGAPLAADIQVHLNVDAIMNRFGDQVRKGLAQAEREMARQNRDATSSGMVGAYFQWLLDAIATMKSLTLEMGAGDQALDLAAIVQDKVAAPPLRSQRVDGMQDLAQFVPPGDVRGEFGGRDTGRSWADLALKVYQRALKDDPRTFEQLKQALDTIARGRTQSAISFSLGGERLLQGTFVMQADDAEAKFAATRRLLDLANLPGVQKAFGSPRVRGEVRSSRDVRRIAGWPVDHVVFTLTSASPRELGPLRRFFEQPFEADLMRIGSYIVYQLNGTPESYERTVTDLLAGKGPHGPLVARSDQPAGGFLYVDVDVPRMVASLSELVPDERRGEWPALDSSISPVTSFGYRDAGASWYRVSVPSRLVGALRDLVGRAGATPGGKSYLPIPKD